MKYLKSYESINEPIYFWKIRVEEPYLEYSLIKLNTTEIQRYNMLRNTNFINSKYIYVAPTANNDSIENKDYLAWNDYDRYGYESFIESGYKYKGELKITLKEIELMKNQNKYNL